MLDKTKVFFSFIIVCFIVGSFNLLAQTNNNNTPNTLLPDQPPVFRGCNPKLNKKELAKCSREKIINFIKLKFDIEMAEELFPQQQYTTFNVTFVINKNGKAEQINAKANKKEIALEAIRVLKQLPRLKKPGYLNGKPVNTPYNITMRVYFHPF